MINNPISSIAFLCHPYHRGGVTKWMSDIAKECTHQNIRAYFVTVYPTKEFISGKNRTTMVEMLGDSTNITVIAPPVNFLFEFGTQEYKTFIYSKAIVENVPPGIPIIVSDDYPVWSAAASLSNRNPMIGVIHSSYDSVYFSQAQKFSKNLTYAVCVSNRSKENLISFVGEKSIPIYVIPCGIALNSFNNQLENSSNNEVLKLIWVGRLEEASKRISDLPKLALQLQKANIPFQMDIIGNGEGESFLKEQIKIHGLSELVKLHGWMENEEVYKKMNTSDLLIMPSNYEGMSVAVMEALAMGIGVVSTRVSGVEDLEHKPETKDCLWLYPVGDLEKAVECIKQAQKVSRETIKRNARNLAESEFSNKTCLERYISMLSQIDVKISEMKPAIALPIIKKCYSFNLALLRMLKLKMRN